MIKEIIIADDLLDYLEKRKLDKQYKKAKKYILNWLYNKVRLKLREPKKKGIYYFRINDQYRCLCIIDWNILKIFDIDNHQK